MTRSFHGSARRSRVFGLLSAAVGLSAAFATLAQPLPVRGDAASSDGTRIVRAPSSVDSDGDGISDQLEQALDHNDFHALPNSVMPAHSAIANLKGAGDLSATVVDAIVCFDHAPTAADTRALTANGFAVKDVFSRLVYAVHIIGPAPKGAQTLLQLAGKIQGITYIGPNNAGRALLQHSTRQIRARQSWTQYQNYNFGLPLSGDPGRTIAIMDTGIDASHPDLNGGTASARGNKITAWYDAYSSSGPAVDVFGHGSHVAGIAAGTGVSGGIATGTGYLPLTITGNFLGDNQNVIQLNNDNIPVDTTGFSGPATLTLDGYWSQFLVGATNSFTLYDQTDGKDSVAQTVIAQSGSSQPVSSSITVPQNTAGNYYVGFETSSATNISSFVVHLQSPNTAIGDGFNLLTGVAPSSSLVGIGAAQPDGSFPTDATIRGYDYLSQNQQRYNIGVVNMSFGLPILGDGLTLIDPVADTAIANLVNQGIVCAIAAGNSRDTGAGISSPGSASAAITVAALGNQNQISEYSSYGAAGQSKPDVAAPGGSFPELITMDSTGAFVGLTATNPAHAETITSVDTNADDLDEVGSVQMQDVYPNDYTNMEGTSMATPHVAGAVALIEQAFSMPGELGGQRRTGGDEAKFIKALLEMTSTETNQPADQDMKQTSGSPAAPMNPTAPNPTLDQGARDNSEGFGKINVDAALSAVLQSYVPGATATDTFGPGVFDKVAWARNVSLTAGIPYTFTLAGGATDTAGSEFDLYLYSTKYSDDGSISNGAVGDAIILKKSVTVGAVAQTLTYTPAANEVDVIVVKRVTGSGPFTLTSTGGTASPLAVTVVDAGSSAPLNNAIVTATGTTTNQQYDVAPTANGVAALNVPTTSTLNLTATAFGYYSSTIPAAGAQAVGTIPLTPSHAFQTGLQMISVPAEYSMSIVDATLPHIYTAAVWSPGQLGYLLLSGSAVDTFHLGQAYWVRLKQPSSIVAHGTPAPAGTFSIPLTSGWNMIGSPYANPASLTTASVISGANTYAFPDAASRGLVSLLYAYDPASNGYVTVPSNGTMTPYAGYWIHSNGSTTLLLAGS